MSRAVTPGSAWHEALPVLLNGNVLLREPTLADAATLGRELGNQEVARFMSRPPSGARGFERFIAYTQRERSEGRSLCYGVVPVGEPRAVGLIQVRELEPGFVSAEWGFCMGRRFWGTGLFMAAAGASVDFLFRHAGVHRLEARAAVSNGRGNGVLQKLGARPEGILRKAFELGDQRLDQLLWSLHRDDWLRDHRMAVGEVRAAVSDPALAGDPPGVCEDVDPTVPEPWQHELPVLENRGVTLRELRLPDAAVLQPLMSAPGVAQYLPPPPDGVNGFERFIRATHARRREGTCIYFGMVPAGKDHAVGVFQLHRLDLQFRVAEWGFALGEPYWGTGLFREAAELLLEFAFDRLGVRRLEARAPVANARGNAVLRRMGATQEGRLSRSFLLANEYHDDTLWALLDDEWRARRQRTMVSRRPTERV